MGLLDGKLGGVAAVIKMMGATVYLRRFREGEYDPDTRKKESLETFGSPHETEAVWSGYLAGSTRFDLGADGVVQPGDRQLMLVDNGLPFDPEGGDVIEFPNRRDPSKPRTRYRVMNADPIPSGDDIPFWQLQVRI